MHWGIYPEFRKGLKNVINTVIASDSEAMKGPLRNSGLLIDIVYLLRLINIVKASYLRIKATNKIFINIFH